MGLESATYIEDLVVTNPPGNDLRSQGDDHIRLIKQVLKNTFPGADRALTFRQADGGSGDKTFTTDFDNGTWYVDTGSSPTMTLPTSGLGLADAGFNITIVKTSSDANPFFVQAQSGQVRSGQYQVDKCRRAKMYVPVRCVWTGSDWMIERTCHEPIASLIEFYGTDLPQGYEWPNGQTLLEANYFEYNMVRGGSSTPDKRGYVAAGKDNMGGSSANRLNGNDGIPNGDTLEDTGGEEYHTLDESQMPVHSHSGGGTTDDENQNHTHTFPGSGNLTYSGGGTGPSLNSNNTGTTSGNNRGHTHTFGFDTDEKGGDQPHANVQPTIIANFLLVVE